MVASATVAAVLPLIIQGDWAGRLYEGDCLQPGARGYHASILDAAPAGLEPLILGTGDLLAPDPAVAHAVEVGADAHQMLADVWVRKNKLPFYDALLLGNLELSLPRGALAELTETARLPWVISNLAPNLKFERERIVRRGPWLIGITGILDEQLLPTLHPSVREESLSPAGPALSASVDRLRALGVHYVVAMAHVGGKDGAQRLVQLLDGLQSLPDVVVSSGLAGGVELIQLRNQDLTVIPASPRVGTVVTAQIILGPKKKIEAISEVQLTPQPDPQFERLRARTCNDLAEPLGPMVSAEQFLDREAFARFILALLREKTGAEIAVVNLGALNPGAFPLRAPIDYFDLQRAMPFGDTVHQGEIRGAALGALSGLINHPKIRVLGLEKGKVAGRNIDATRTYRVVALEFVAAGGDGALEPGKITFEALELGTARDLVADFLRESGYHPDADIDPDQDIAEPALLGARVNLGANLKTVTVAGEEGYEAPQLTRRNFLGVSALLDIRLSADFVDHRLELGERSRFGVAKDDREPSQENDDVTIFEATYLWRAAGPASPRYVPNVSATTSLETELTVPEEQGRGYRRALLQVGAGPSWPLLPNLTVRAQMGARRELLADPNSPNPEEANSAALRAALISALELANYALPLDSGAPLTLSLRVNHVLDLTGVARDNILQGRADFDIPIGKNLALTAGLETYIQHRAQEGMDRRVGIAFDTLFGIKTFGDLSLTWFR